VDRWFTRPIAGRTLATFKALAETVAAEAAPSRAGPRPASAESDSVRTTNQPA
jgi:hypothetical protein